MAPKRAIRGNVVGPHTQLEDRPHVDPGMDKRKGEGSSRIEYQPGFAYLPVGPVEATVDWVNRRAPQVLKNAIGRAGEQANAPFAFFRTHNTYSASPKPGRDAVLCIPLWAVPNSGGGHGRSVRLMGNFSFGTPSGEKLASLDIKGVGPSALKRGPRHENDFSDTGTYDLRLARRDRDYALKFLRQGARVALPVGIIKLRQVYDKGGRISMDEAKKRGLVSPIREPVLYLRGVESSLRLNDAEHADMRAYFYAHRKERGWRTMTDYGAWLASEAAKSLAIIRNSGLDFQWPHSQNFTIAGEILDFDSVMKPEKTNQYTFDGKLKFMLSEIIHNTSIPYSPDRPGDWKKYQRHENRIRSAFVKSYAATRTRGGWEKDLTGGIRPFIASHAVDYAPQTIPKGLREKVRNRFYH